MTDAAPITPAWQARNFLIGIRLLRDQVPSFEQYPFTIPAIGGFEELRLEQPVTFFIGENGSGKSTLLDEVTRNFLNRTERMLDLLLKPAGGSGYP